MNKKILISLSIIGAVAAIAVGGTIAYFSDTETSTGNTFTAGALDLTVDNDCYYNVLPGEGQEPNCPTVANDPSTEVNESIVTTWALTDLGVKHRFFWFNDVKPGDFGEDTISLHVDNDAWLRLLISAVTNNGNGLTEPEDVVDADADADHKTIDDVFGTAGTREVYLGMIPAGGKMKVKQSYHMNTDTTNWAQGDQMTFDIVLRAMQIQGTAVLENKQGPEPWHLVLGDDIQGTLTYIVKNPTFNFNFTGKAPLIGHNYVLAAGMKSVSGNNYDVDTYLGQGISGGDGAISISGNVELGKDMKNVKVWLVPAENWSAGMNWAGWPGIVPNFLWETGLIWYDDTNN